VLIKTLAVNPAYQRQGVGSALVHSLHVDALKDKKREVSYALIRDINNIQHFPHQDATVFRRYASFEFNIAHS